MSKGKFAKRKGVASKTLVIALAVMLVVGCTIGGTLAYLTSKTGPVTNTFSVGNVTITLEEHKLADLQNGLPANAETVKEQTGYKIVPGSESPKDPFVTVKQSSELCYVYVLVENNLVIGNDVVGTPNIDGTKWQSIKNEGTKTLYRYVGTTNSIVDATAADVVLPVFTKVEYDGQKINEGNITSLNNKTIVLTAFAHQQVGVTQAEADNAAIAQFFPTTSGD